MKVMKFGGASIADAPKILKVSKVIKKYSRKERVVVVVSAIKGVTDKLFSIFDSYKDGNLVRAISKLKNLYALHIEILRRLRLEKLLSRDGFNQINEFFGQLTSCLIFSPKLSLPDLDYVVSFGERLSCSLMTTTLKNFGVRAKFVLSSQLIITNDDFGNADPILGKTKEAVENNLAPLLIGGVVPVVTGYFGRTEDGKITTLGRGGSDYSATILAYALDAQEVILWKEVNGIFTGDPQKNNKVKFIPELTYQQAIILAQAGAKVLHPKAMEPVAEKEIVVWVKNIFNPKFIGSKIWKGK